MRVLSPTMVDTATVYSAHQRCLLGVHHRQDHRKCYYPDLSELIKCSVVVWNSLSLTTLPSHLRYVLVSVTPPFHGRTGHIRSPVLCHYNSLSF